MATTLPLPRTIVTPLVGIVSVLVVPANVTRNGLFVFNPNAIVTIAFSPSDSTPTINGAGSITLLAGTGIQLNDWTTGVNAVAGSGSSNTITVLEF